MELILFFGLFLLLMLIGVPLAFAMLLPSFITLWQTGVPATVVAQTIVDPITSPSFLAVPFFILVAEILNATQVSDKLFEFARRAVGWMPGGLGQANVLGSMIFAGMSGSAIADAAGLGRIEVKAMTDAGYDMAESAAITASSSVIGPIIPPSIPLAVYGIISGQSIAELFMGGFIPGVLMGICLMIITGIRARRRPDLFPREPPISFGELITSTREAFWALLLPVFIIGGLLTGYFTATEAGSAGTLYALVLAISTGTFSAKAFYRAFVITMRSTAQVMIILGAAMAFSWVITVSQVPQSLVAFVLSVTSSKYVILLAIGVIVLIMGCFLAGNAVLVILGPMLIAVAPDLDINLLHLGVFMTIGCMIAVITPPVGGCLFAISTYTGLTIGQLGKACVPYLIAIVVSWIIVLFVPETVTWLPGLIWKRG